MIPKRLWLPCFVIVVGLFLAHGCVPAETDTDKDGVANTRDNCANKANPDQKDYDGDGYGDVCDNCPKLTFLRFSDQRDSDGDGIGDVCDNCINAKNADQTDTDYDGIGDACSAQARLHDYELLAKATPDECYYGIGEANTYDPIGFDLEKCMASGGKPKTNEGYIWGMTKVGDNIYFGTFDNAVCSNTDTAHAFDTTEIWVCEDGKENNTNPVADGDYRPPSIYVYNTKTRSHKRLPILEKDIPLLNSTLGLRSATNHKGVVFLAGPNTGGSKINLFAFNAATGAPLGAQALPYRNIRKWLVVKDALYCGVDSLTIGGAVLKWTGSIADPFQFTVVGKNFGGTAAYLCFHEGRIFVSTWPFPDLASITADLIPFVSNAGVEASVWMSPVIDSALDGSHANKWQKVWSVYDYDPDLLCATFTGGGPLLSYNGWLYWGTMHPKNQAELYLLAQTLTMSPADKVYAAKGAYRASSIFRGRNFGNASKTIELLYGEESMDVFNLLQGWHKVANKMSSAGLKPKFGHSGFGNWANNYLWAMEIHKGKLYLGTMDDLGADLYCFPNSESEAQPVNLLGFGNMANFGIRNMISDGDDLYLGTANHYSLSTFTAEELFTVNPELVYLMNPAYTPGLNAAGGWELIHVQTE